MNEDVKKTEDLNDNIDLEKVQQDEAKKDLNEENVEPQNKQANVEDNQEIKYTFYGEKENVKVSEPLFGKEDYVNQEEHPYLFNNPFLHNTACKQEVEIDSIEDFAVKYKKEKVYFGSVVHNDKIDVKTKKKLVKKSFKSWKKDFNETSIDAIHNMSKTIETMEMTNVRVAGWQLKTTLAVFIILELVFLVFLMNSTLSLIPVEMLLNASKSLMDSFNNNIVYKILIAMPIVLLFIMLVINVIFIIRSRKFVKLRKKVKKFSDKSLKEIRSKFKKTYPKTYKYYLKNVSDENAGMFTPLKIDEVSCNSCDVKDTEELIVEAVQSAAKQTKRSKRTRGFTILLLVLFILMVLVSCVLFVVAMVM